MKKVVSILLSIVLVGIFLTGCSSSNNASSSSNASENVQEADVTAKEVNIAMQPASAFIPLYVAREKGWIEEALKEYGVTVNWNDFESGPPMNESLASGESDFAFLGDVPSVSALAAGQDNEFVGIAAYGPKYYAMLVSADNNDIKSIKDLKGKKIATVIGSTGHNLTKKLFEENGMDINKDAEIVNISAGDASTVLSTNQVDAVAIWEPNITRLVDNKTAKVLATGDDCGLRGVNPIVVRSEYAKQNKTIVKVILEQYARAVAELDNLDDETTKAVADYFSLEPNQVQEVASKNIYSVKMEQEDIDSLQDTIEFLVSIGSIDKSFEVKDYMTTEYLDSADVDQYLK